MSKKAFFLSKISQKQYFQVNFTQKTKIWRSSCTKHFRKHQILQLYKNYIVSRCGDPNFLCTISTVNICVFNIFFGLIPLGKNEFFHYLQTHSYSLQKFSFSLKYLRLFYQKKNVNVLNFLPKSWTKPFAKNAIFPSSLKTSNSLKKLPFYLKYQTPIIPNLFRPRINKRKFSNYWPKSSRTNKT